MTELIDLLLAAWPYVRIGTFFLFLLGWLLSERFQNAGFADVCWGLGLLVTTALLVNTAPYSSPPLRLALLMLVVALAYGRLSWHIIARFVKQWPTEDPRYHALREQWNPKARWNMLGVFLLQAGFMAILAWPLVLITNGNATDLLPLEWIAVALGLAAFVGEMLADQQLAQFQSNPAHKGQICQAGLWRYSRHPNYFFQWLFWVSLAVWSTVTHPMGWIGWIAPAMMLHFLLNVTGVKPTEEGMLKSRGDAFRDYQRTTSAFIPWFPKKRTA